MDSRRVNYTFRIGVSFVILCIFIAPSTFFPLCKAKSEGRVLQGLNLNKPWKKLKSVMRFGFNDLNPVFMGFPGSDQSSYGSPSSLPLPPFNTPAPQPSPSPSPPTNLPDYSPISKPPHSHTPSPLENRLSPPPPKHGPSPLKPGPSPPQAYHPPLVYPPPPSTVTGSPPPPHKKPQHANWCVAKPTVPDPVIQEAMDYACGSGADCKSIQPNGPCYQPNTLLAHASYAFNSYWQNTKASGGTCDFGGTAMLVTFDPSFERCHFTLT